MFRSYTYNFSSKCAVWVAIETGFKRVAGRQISRGRHVDHDGDMYIGVDRLSHFSGKLDGGHGGKLFGKVRVAW